MSRSTILTLCCSSAITMAAAISVLSASTASAAVGNWSSSGPFGGSTHVVEVYEGAPNTIFSAGRSGVFRSLNSGTSWDRIQIGLPETIYVNALVSANNNPILYLASSQSLFRSGNAGELWIPVSRPQPASDFIYDVAIRRGTNNSIAVATSNGIYVSNNGGGTWSGPGTSAGVTIRKAQLSSDGTIYGVIDTFSSSAFAGALMIKSVDSGSTWAPIALPTAINYLDPATFSISPADPQRLFVSDGFNILMSANGGTTWSTFSPPAIGAGCSDVLSVSSHPTQISGVVVGCLGNGVHITNDLNLGVWTTWTSANGLSPNGIETSDAISIALHPAFPTTPTLWIGATDGGLFRSTNAGTSWSAINDGYRGMNIRALATHPVDTNPAGAVVLAGYGDAMLPTQTILKSSNGAGAWQLSVTGLKAKQIRSLTIDPTTVDTNPLTTENFTVYAGGRSERIPTTANKDGGIYKSTDAGVTWTTIDNGIATISGVRDMGTVRSIALDPRSCVTPPASGPCPIGASPLRTLYAAGSGRIGSPFAGSPLLSARIYKSVDAGANWTASDTGIPIAQDLGPVGANNVASIGGVVPLVIDPQNTQIIYAGTFLTWNNRDQPGATEPSLANGVFKSTNGGATWVHSSNGLPRYAGPGSSQRDVLALAINPSNPSILYAGVVDLYSTPLIGRVFKTVDGGANWFESSTGIAGFDVRALFIDPTDPSGNTIYAGTGGDGANRGGVFRSTNGGVSWNSISLGLPANAATSLAMPPRAPGAPARILAGTDSGVWDYTMAADEDADGAPSAVENSVVGGDGNGDGLPDSSQPSVASLSTIATQNGLREGARGANVEVTLSLVAAPASCTQLNDTTTLPAALYPPDPLGTATSHDPWGLVSFSLPACSAAKVLVKFHGANFDSSWTWRNYGPRTPGDQSSFGWYSYAGARRVDATTWELSIDALRQGNYRPDEHNILFFGGPGKLPDLIFDNGLE